MMTQDEINQMVEQAGFHGMLLIGVVMDAKQLEAFAKLVAEKERDACAKIGDEWAVGWPHPSQVIAERIRERGQ